MRREGDESGEARVAIDAGRSGFALFEVCYQTRLVLLTVVSYDVPRFAKCRENSNLQVTTAVNMLYCLV
jgi:hypothetical protein